MRRPVAGACLRAILPRIAGWRAAAGFLFGLLLALPLQAGDLEERVVLLANSRQAESVALARFYAEQRGVPAENIVALPLPETETITWRQFVDEVWQPVQDELHRRGWIEGTVSSILDRLGRV